MTKKIGLFLIIGFTSIVMLLIGIGIAWLVSYNGLFPDYKFTHHYKEKMMRSPTIILDRYNKQLGAIGGGADFHIQAVSSKHLDISVLARILFAKEDRKIKDFNGIQRSGISGKIEAAFEVISWKGKARAVYQTFIGSKQGASGLLEQIAGNLYGHQNHNPWFKGVRLLGSLERKMVKTINAICIAHLYKNPEQVVEDYVNLTYTAGMYHGIKIFMLNRFNKDIEDVLIKINLNRSYLSDNKIDVINMLAYYVGQLTGPANYDPNTARNPIQRFRIEKRANFKKDLVLTQLEELGLINKSLYLKAKNRKLSFSINEIAGVKYNPNIDLIKRHVLMQKQSIIGGRIKTTLIKKIQHSANYQLLKTRTALSMLATKTYKPSKVRFFRRGRLKQYGIYRVQVLKRNKRAVTINLGEKYGSRIIRIPEYLSKKTLKLFSKGKSISIGIDGFNAEGLPQISLIQKNPLIKGAFIVKGLADGEVLTFGGGRYLTARISPGSAVKPFLLDKALLLNWTLDDQLNNSCDLKYRIFSQPYYSPKNYGSCNENKKGFERYPTLKTVIKESINKPVIYLLSHLTAKLSEDDLRNEIVDIVKEYKSDDLEAGDFVYQPKNNSMELSIISDDNKKRFIGRISLAGKRDKLIFEKIRKERYLELTAQHSYEQMTDVLDYDYNEFLKWYSFVNDIIEQFQMLKDIKRRGPDPSNTTQYRDSNEIAALNHFFYDDHGKLTYDPHLRDNITFIDMEVINDFLEKYKASDVNLGAFTVSYYLRFDDIKEDLRELSDSRFNERMFIFDSEFQRFLNIEIFKNHLAALLDIDKSLIKGNFSLPLGTYRISLIDLVNMYSQVLTTAEHETDTKNNQTLFLKPQEDTKIEMADFQLNEESGLYKALYAARNEKGGTSTHLKSNSILAGKTGTDPKYKTYVSVVDINGRLFLAAAYFGVDRNKHEKLVKSWTGGWTAGVFINNIVTDINKNYSNYFPSEKVAAIEFDESFEYDGTTDSLEDDEQYPPDDDRTSVNEESDQEEIDDLNDDSMEPEEEDSGTDESDYTSEDIDNILVIEE